MRAALEVEASPGSRVESMIEHGLRQRPRRLRSESFEDWKRSEKNRKKAATKKARETLSGGARRFWISMSEFRRPEDDPERVERLARKAATNGHRRRHENKNLRRSAEELVRLKYAKHGTEPDKGDVRRACPQCRGAVRWLVVRGRVEAPWCPSCGPLGFWLVCRTDTMAAIGYGGHSASGMW